MPLYVGFDSSTQSLTATVIQVDGRHDRVVFEESIDFDSAFPGYRTSHGVVTEDERTVTSPPLMWVEALEAMAGRLRDSGLDLNEVRAISGSAQQHGSVYLARGAFEVLGKLDPVRPVGAQIADIFTRAQSPVWLDCSTSAQCDALTRAIGGDAALASLTGSRAYERFTAAQIAKFAAADPDAYARTARIHLVSSFMASVLCGCEAPLEPGDGSGMNLMDISSAAWAPHAVDVVAPDLSRKLPPIRSSSTLAGVLSPYWQRRIGCGAAKVVAWTGDNPSSLIGLGLVERGEIGISLGTSDTVFAPIAAPAADPSGAGHVFGSPTGEWMALTCFANGSLARERVRDRFGLDWRGFSAHLATTPPGNGGAMMIPWFVPEITPRVPVSGPHRTELDADDAARNVRAVIEGQALAMRIHCSWFAPEVKTIRVTGGAAINREILQVIGDVFDAEVIRIAPPNAASLGAALRAYHADRLSQGEPLAWRRVVAPFTQPAGDRVIPRADAVRTYAAMLPRYRAFADRLR